MEGQSPELNQTDTGGGAYIGKDVNAGRDVAGRDIVNNYYDSQLASKARQAEDINPSELFLKAIRLQLDGKLGQALEIYQQIKAIDPYFPRLNHEILAIQRVIERGHKKGYLNDWDEVVNTRLLHLRDNTELFYISGSGGVGKTRLLQWLQETYGLNLRSQLLGNVIRHPYYYNSSHLQESKIVFYFAEIRTGSELLADPNSNSEVIVKFSRASIIRVDLDSNELPLKVKDGENIWMSVRYHALRAWLLSPNLGRSIKISLDKYYGQ